MPRLVYFIVCLVAYSLCFQFSSRHRNHDAAFQSDTEIPIPLMINRGDGIIETTVKVPFLHQTPMRHVISFENWDPIDGGLDVSGNCENVRTPNPYTGRKAYSWWDRSPVSCADISNNDPPLSY